MCVRERIKGKRETKRRRMEVLGMLLIYRVLLKGDQHSYFGVRETGMDRSSVPDTRFTARASKPTPFIHIIIC